MKNTMRKAMLSTIAMLVVAVMSLTGVTYAWFSASTTANVTGMTMNVGTAGAGLQVSAEGGDGVWGSEVDFAFEGQEGEAKLQPVSTVDAVDFYTATVSVDDPSSITSITKDTNKANVWTETFYLRNTGTGDLTVILDADVAVFADASGDTAHKAARIAIFEGTTLKYIYGDHTANTFLGITDVASSYPVDMDDAENAALDSVTSFTNSASTIELTAPGYDDSNNEQGEQAYTILVWLEGQDPECTNDAALSSFTVNLSFQVKQ